MLLIPYIGTMQAGPDPGTPSPLDLGKFDMEEDIPMHNPSSTNAGK